MVVEHQSVLSQFSVFKDINEFALIWGNFYEPIASRTNLHGNYFDLLVDYLSCYVRTFDEDHQSDS